MIARLFFCLTPAVVAGGLTAILHPVIGGAVFVGLLCLGIEVTDPRKGR